MGHQSDNLSDLLQEVPRAIYYWADEGSLTLLDERAIAITFLADDGKQFRVSRPQLGRAAVKIAIGEIELSHPLRYDIAAFVGALDGRDALLFAGLEGEPFAVDAIVQAAVFGEVKYG